MPEMFGEHPPAAAHPPETHEDLGHALVPLALAAHHVLWEVYGSDFLGAHAPWEEKLNAVAMAISVLVPIFEHGECSLQGARRIAEADLDGGRFTSGAREFQFRDGRRSGLLAVRATDVGPMVQILRQARR